MESQYNSQTTQKVSKVYEGAPRGRGGYSRRRGGNRKNQTTPELPTEPVIGQKQVSDTEAVNEPIADQSVTSSTSESTSKAIVSHETSANMFIPAIVAPIVPKFHFTQLTFRGEHIKMQAYNDINPSEFVDPLYRFTFCRTPTQLFAFSNFIAPRNSLSYCRSLLFVGDCVKCASKAKSEFKSIDDFNNGAHKFAIRRFGYIPKTPEPTMEQVANVWLSPTYVSLCYGIKAEMMLAAYWRYREDPTFSRLVCSMITYAVKQYENHPGSEDAKKFRYIFELSIAFNFFVQINDEITVGLPEASTFKQSMKYNEWQEFGSFQPFHNVDPSDPRWYLQLVPRTQTDIDFNKVTMFYIPYHSKVIEDSTTCAILAVNQALLAPGIREFLVSLTFMTNYMRNYRIAGSETPVHPAYTTYESEEDARKEVVDAVTFPEDFNINVKFCLKVKTGEGKYEAVVLSKQTKEQELQHDASSDSE